MTDHEIDAVAASRFNHALRFLRGDGLGFSQSTCAPAFAASIEIGA